MKKHQRQNDSFERTLEQVEQMIERMDTDKPIRISDITKKIKPATCNGDITKATAMLLQKYGITYLED